LDGLRVFFNRYVYFTIFIAFAAGILTARHIPLLEFPWGVLLGGLAVLLALWMLLILSWRRYVSERLVLGFLYALVFAGGLFYMWLHLAFMGSVPLSRFDGKSGKRAELLLARAENLDSADEVLAPLGRGKGLRLHPGGSGAADIL